MTLPFALAHLLAVGIEHPAADDHVVPRHVAVVQPGLGDRVEGPRADDLVRLRPDVHGKSARVALGVQLPTALDLGAQRARRPRVLHVGVADEAARLPPLRLAYPGGAWASGSTGSIAGGGRSGRSCCGCAPVVERVPDREGHAEVALAADAPVLIEAFDPAPITGAHVRRVPLDTLAPLEELLAEIEEPDKPLPRWGSARGAGPPSRRT